MSDSIDHKSASHRTSDACDTELTKRDEALPRPQLVELGSVVKLTGKGRQYEDGRKYDERQ